MSLEKVPQETPPNSKEADSSETVTEEQDGNDYDKLTSSKLAKKLSIRTSELFDKAVGAGLLELKDGKHYLTAAGKSAGVEFRVSKKFGPYFIWPEKLEF